MKHRWFLISMIGIFSFFYVSAIHAGDNPKIGDTMIFAGDFAPQGWEYCDGKRLDISANQELFSQIGITHGGDGRESFYLPNMKAVEETLNGAKVFIALEGQQRRSNNGDVDVNQSYIGEISVHFGDTPPAGWAFCDGKVITSSDSPELVNILGNRFGGNGTSSAALPDLQDAEKTMNGLRYIIALEGVVPRR